MRPADVTGSDDTDEALMLAYAQHGDVAAFERLYARHKGPTYRYFLRHGALAAVADELHQDVWLKVVRAREHYVARARFTTWLYTLVRHRLVDHWRAQGGKTWVSLDETGPEDEAGAAAGERGTTAGNSDDDQLTLAIDDQAGGRLVTALADVPPAQRDAFLLHVEGGLSLEASAGLTGAPVETIKSRLRYAYRRLRTALEDLR